MPMRVAVLGAGAAGLCAARHLLSRPRLFAPPVVYEPADGVGGTWRYDEGGAADSRGRRAHSSMYRDLRTNLPKEVMMFPDFPFDPQLSSFMSHRDVLNYLHSYSTHFNIGPHIRFGTMVEEVKPVVMAAEGEDERIEWEVTSSDAGGRRTTQMFDSVFVCTGHYSDPYIPEVAGLQSFSGSVLHSHDYRVPEPFAGRTVLVVGAGASGRDISNELAKAGAKVLLSHRRPARSFPLHPEVQEVGPLAAIERDGRARFKDGGVGVADVLLFCTGYKFSFPFLDTARLGLQVLSHQVAPLHLHLLPPAFPSLFFIGLCKMILPFPHFNCQVQFALAVLSGGVELPPRALMEEEARQAERHKLERGVEERHLLTMGRDQWEYCQLLASRAGFAPLPPVVSSLYEEVRRQRGLHHERYRERNYTLVSDTQWALRE